MDRTVDKYLSRSARSFERPLVAGDLSGVERVVVIPALAESDHLMSTIACLEHQADRELEATFVIVVVNNRCQPHATAAQIEDNRRTLDLLENRGFDDAGLRVGWIDAASPGRELGPKMGVGDARRIGLDHGLRILIRHHDSGGLLISLDGDSRVDPNYLEAVRDHFEDPARGAAVIDYAHRLDGSADEVAAIVAYELYLRYHACGLSWAGSPYAYPAIGSTMVCRASAYVAAGGMNRRQAAEDFYFLQQLQKTGGVDVIRATRVRPSCRPSDRVPFGTGATVTRLLDEGLDSYQIYNAESYRVLRRWLRVVAGRLESDVRVLLAAAEALHPGLGRHLESRGFAGAWTRIRKNSASGSQLQDQFHRWFDGFETLKMLHFLRDEGLAQQPLDEAFRDARRLWGFDTAAIDWSEHGERVGLLHALREI